MVRQEVLTELLGEILANDQEIREGAQEADVSLDELRASLSGRFDEVVAACRQEQNLLEDLELKVVASAQRAERIRTHPTWYIRLTRWSAWAAIATVATAVAFTWLTWGLLGNRRLGLLWTEYQPASLLMGMAGAFVAIGVLLLVEWRVNRTVNEVLSGAEHQLLVAWRDAASASWESALRGRGLKGVLREEINLRRPRYDMTLEIRRADGLAEMHNPLHLVASDAEVRIERLMQSMPGGSIGVSGPRGVGKTTLLRHFCSAEFAAPEEKRGKAVRVLLSAPVRYDAREFVIHMFASVCYGVIGPDNRGAQQRVDYGALSNVEDRLLMGQVFRLVAGLLAAWGTFLFIANATGWKLSPSTQNIVLILIASAVGYYLAMLWRRSARLMVEQPRFSDGDDNAANLATTLLLGLSYQQIIGSSWSAAVRLPVSIEVGASSNTTMTEKPMGFPELVARLDAFLRQVSLSRRVYIGIDELDKFDSTAQVYEFLNDIKGIFGIPGCFYLISLSENAMSAFERRGLPLRDAFDSAFDTVVNVASLDYVKSRRILRRRVIGMPEHFMALAHVLSGGLPRDLIRAARDIVILSQEEGSVGDLGSITAALTAAEAVRKMSAARLAAHNTGLTVSDAFLSRFPIHTEGGSVLQMQEASVSMLAALLDRPMYDSERHDDERWNELRRIVLETAAYLYFCGTVQEFFGTRADGSERGGGVAQTVDRDIASDADALARCRRMFTASPRLAWVSISEFRSERQLLPWDSLAVGLPGHRDAGRV